MAGPQGISVNVTWGWLENTCWPNESGAIKRYTLCTHTCLSALHVVTSGVAIIRKFHSPSRQPRWAKMPFSHFNVKDWSQMADTPLIQTVRSEMWGTQIDWATFHVWPNFIGTHPKVCENMGIFFPPNPNRLQMSDKLTHKHNAGPFISTSGCVDRMIAATPAGKEEAMTVSNAWGSLHSSDISCSCRPWAGVRDLQYQLTKLAHTDSSMEILKHKDPWIIPAAASPVTIWRTVPAQAVGKSVNVIIQVTDKLLNHLGPIISITGERERVQEPLVSTVTRCTRTTLPPCQQKTEWLSADGVFKVQWQKCCKTSGPFNKTADSKV